MNTVIRAATTEQSNRSGRSERSKGAQTKSLWQSSENNGFPLARKHSSWRGNLAMHERFSLNNPVCERDWALHRQCAGEQKGQKTGLPSSVLSGFPTAVARPLSPRRPPGTDDLTRSSGRGFRASVTAPLLPRWSDDGRVSDGSNVREHPPIRDWLPISGSR